jgi:hypothetical protein
LTECIRHTGCNNFEQFRSQLTVLNEFANAAAQQADQAVLAGFRIWKRYGAGRLEVAAALRLIVQLRYLVREVRIRLAQHIYIKRVI